VGLLISILLAALILKHGASPMLTVILSGSTWYDTTCRHTMQNTTIL